MKRCTLLGMLVMIGFGLPLLQAQIPTNDLCQCLTNLEELIVTTTSDQTICQGDTTLLEATPLGISPSFPQAYFLTRDQGTLDPVSLIYGDMTIGFTNELDLSGAVSRVTSMAVKEDSVFLLTANRFILYANTSISEVDTLSRLPNIPGGFWTGFAYDAVNQLFYGLWNNPPTESRIYELDIRTPDTVQHVATLPARSQWLTVNGAGMIYSGNPVTDSLYVTDPSTGDSRAIGPFGINARVCQGADFDPITGELYAAMHVFGQDSLRLGILDTATGSFCETDRIYRVGEEFCGFAVGRTNVVAGDGYRYAWSPDSSLSDPTISNPLAFPTNNTTYQVIVTDSCGRSDTSEVFVTVRDQPNPLSSQSCLSEVNVSLDSNCQAEILPSQILTPNYVCANQFFEVSITGRTSPLVDGNDIGLTLEVSVSPIGGGNSCWGSITVQDDFVPTIVCEDDTIPYGTAVASPAGFDNCGSVRVDTLDLDFFSPTPCDTNILFASRETLVAVDEQGNRSDTCTRTIFYERPMISMISLPDSLSVPSNNPISCDTIIPTNAQGYPAISFAGEPMINGVAINDLPSIFQVGAFSVDVPQSAITSCKTSVLRVWTIVNWVCNQMDTLAVYPQLIEVVDTTGPEVVCNSFDTLSTSGNTCSASFLLPYPAATDNCSDIDRITVTYGMQTITDLQPGGAMVELPVGVHEIKYTVIDECLRSTQCIDTIVIEDRNQPTIIGKKVNVSLNNFGPTRVYANSFDDGSFDDCMLDYLEIARMSDLQFGPYIDFDCDDVGGAVMVVLRGFDKAGNQNQVMTEVHIQDKNPAQIVAPDDVTVSCEYPINLSQLDDFGTVVYTDDPNALFNRILEPTIDSILLTDPGESPVQQRFYGLGGILFDNCGASATTVEVRQNVEHLDCNAMRITRVFNAVANGIIEDSDVQIIHVQNINPFNASTIRWPRDTMISNGCQGGGTEPEDLPDGYNYPRYEETACSNIAISHKDSRFFSQTNGDSVCVKILREWQVMDWCKKDQNGDPYIYSRSQLIKVVNRQAPIFSTSCDTLRECSNAANCGPGFIRLTKEAVDDCTSAENLQWSYTIDLFNDGGSPERFGNSNDATGEYPIGQHRITWTVEDECGNRSNCVQIFEIESCKPPTPIAASGVVIELTPMDTDGDGVSDAAMSQITAAQLGYKSYHSCGYDIRLSFDASNLSDTVAIFDCDDVGIVELMLFATDVNGRQDFVRTYVAIQDNQLFCGTDPGPIFPIRGTISNPAGRAVSETEVIMDGDTYFEVETNQKGDYEFPSMPGGGSYTISPYNNSHLLLGVNSIDLVYIQRHILGLSTLTDPRSIIASDVDNNKRISGKDIIELRKAILGKTVAFPNNTSWRFVDPSFVFSPSDPLQQNFPESYEIHGLDDPMDIDFTAIKIGDVDHSASFDLPGSVSSRSASLALDVFNQEFERGDQVEIPVYAGEDITSIFALQGSLFWNSRSLTVTEVEAAAIDIEESQLAMRENDLAIVWTNPHGQQIEKGTHLFTLFAEAKTHGSVQANLGQRVDGLQARIHSENGTQKWHIEIRETQHASEAGYYLAQNQPNPCRAQTTIRVHLPEEAKAKLRITDVNGRMIWEETQSFAKGWNEFDLYSTTFPRSGMYYYQVQTDHWSASKTMVVVQ